MTIDAKVFQINIHQKFIEIVIRKKKSDKYLVIAFVGFNNIKEIVSSLGIEKTDKIRIHYTLVSKQFVNKDGVKRYNTSAIIDDIDLLEKNAQKQTQIVFVDKETGEIIENF